MCGIAWMIDLSGQRTALHGAVGRMARAHGELYAELLPTHLELVGGPDPGEAPPAPRIRSFIKECACARVGPEPDNAKAAHVPSPSPHRNPGRFRRGFLAPVSRSISREDSRRARGFPGHKLTNYPFSRSLAGGAAR